MATTSTAALLRSSFSWHSLRGLARPWDFAAGRVVILSAWCMLLFGYGINRFDLWRTEGLRARVAHEMLVSGNWIVPTLYGEPIFTKPPIHYIAIVLCSLPFGAVTDWSARLPSALAATVVVLLFYTFCRRYLGKMGGLIGALMVPMSPMWIDKAPSAEIDMLLVMWIAASLLCFFRALDAEESGLPAARWWYPAMACMALGILTKWTAPAFFYGTAVPLLWWRGRLRLLVGKHHLLGLVLTAGICLAWIAAAVYLEGWELFFETVKREGLSRLVPNYDRPYRYHEALMHPLLLLAVTLPLSVLTLWTLSPRFVAVLSEREKFFVQAMHAWTWPNILICTYLAEHTPRHSFPLFPGIAGLATVAWLVWYQRRFPPMDRFRLRPVKVLATLLIAWLIIKTVYVEKVLAHRTEKRHTRIKGERLAQLIPAGETLYVFLFKDEGLIFYFGRPALRLGSPEEVARFDVPIYCVLSEDDLGRTRGNRHLGIIELFAANWPLLQQTRVLRVMTDQQGDEILVVRIDPR